jgi:hypothetical protein
LGRKRFGALATLSDGLVGGEDEGYIGTLNDAKAYPASQGVKPSLLVPRREFFVADAARRVHFLQREAA